MRIDRDYVYIWTGDASSRIEIFEGVGHYPHCEQPERFIALLLDFIASTEPARLAMVDAQR